MILDGYKNVYAMKFGMAAWNSDFSSDWLNALDNSSPLYLSGADYPKAELSPLPSLTFSNNDVSVKSKLEERIKVLLSEGFEEKIQTNFLTPVTSFRNLVLSRDSTNYIVCLGDRSFYVSYFGMTHFVGAVNYNFAKPFTELESTKYLQTIPSNKEIDLYSYSGHISAFITAYLRILGYNAKSILFGGNNLVYTAMLSTPGLPQYVFQISDINNYPYVTGN